MDGEQAVHERAIARGPDVGDQVQPADRFGPGRGVLDVHGGAGPELVLALQRLFLTDSEAHPLVGV